MKPGGERVAMILVGLWAATIVVMFGTDWLDCVRRDTGWIVVLGIAYIGISAALDEFLSRRAKRQLPR
jgi:hypothetical protein